MSPDETIEAQGPSRVREWQFTWRTVTWREDGSEVGASGECSVHADCGVKAAAAVERERKKMLSPPYRLKLESTELGPLSGYEHLRSYPRQLPPANTLRAWAVEGRSIAEILEGLAEAPASPLDRMVALEAAYRVELHDLAPVRAFLAQELSEAALEAAVRPLLEGTRGQWSLPISLLEAHAQGRSAGPVLHEYRDRYQLGVIYMIMAMREAFAMSLMDAKSLVETACSGEQDDDLDAGLTAVLAALQARTGP